MQPFLPTREIARLERLNNTSRSTEDLLDLELPE